MGQWSEWGTCSRNNKTCGFKWGLETRTRQIVKKPAKDTIPCPTIAESRRCKMAMRHCPGGEYSPCQKKVYGLKAKFCLCSVSQGWKSSNTTSVLVCKARLQGNAQQGSNQSISRLWNCVFPGVALRVFQRGASWKSHNRLQFALQHGNNANGGRTPCSAHGRKDYVSKPLCRWHTVLVWWVFKLREVNYTWQC